MDVKHCAGCTDDFYNGKNALGVSRCWSLETAKVVLRRRVGWDEAPPWKRKPESLPSCYKQKGYVFVKPEQER